MSRGEDKMPFKAHYWRYSHHYTEEFETLEEAKEMLDYGENYGELSTELIETPNGIIGGDDLYPILGERQKVCALDTPEYQALEKIRRGV